MLEIERLHLLAIYAKQHLCQATSAPNYTSVPILLPSCRQLHR